MLYNVRRLENFISDGNDLQKCICFSVTHFFLCKFELIYASAFKTSLTSKRLLFLLRLQTFPENFACFLNTLS